MRASALPIVLALLAVLALAQAFIVPRAAPLPTKAAVAVRAKTVASFVKRCVCVDGLLL
jgi:hypothetical protein